MFHTIIFPVVYGLIIFLAGMKVMEAALGSWAGPLLSSFLQKATASPLKGMLFSTGDMAVLQSSTAVTVLTMGLVNVEACYHSTGRWASFSAAISAHASRPS